MIQTEALVKKYETTTAVDGLSIHVRQGEIYGFLGPNGAGKTTTILMLLGLVRPTSGQIRIFGRPLKEGSFDLKRRIGVVNEHQFLYEEMTGHEYLRFFGELYSVPKLEERIELLLNKVHLYPRKDERLGGYSHGMRQKIGIARALLHDPDILILDEPQNGLDPHGIREMRDLIRDEQARGKTILISSHILSEIENTCDRVAILHKGRLVVEDEMKAIKKLAQATTTLEIEVEVVPQGIELALRKLEGVVGVRVSQGKIDVELEAGRDLRASISRVLSENGATILELRRHEISLEEAFVTITEETVNRWRQEVAG